MEKLKLIIVDDSEQFRHNLKYILICEFGAQIIGEASNGEEFLSIRHAFQADIILMDLCMPRKNGWEVAKRFLQDNPRSKLIAITMHSDQAFLQQLIEIGFRGCIIKREIIDNLKNAIEIVANGGYYFSENIALKKD